MAKLIIPTPLRKFTENQSSIETSEGTVEQAIKGLANNFPELQKHLFDADGNIRSFVRIYVGEDDIKALDNQNTKLDSSSIVSIIPAIAGGIN
ncbi:MoaD/ThiS family protein [Fulvivirga sp. M361]|uniref:MoaD/ThiS family protein n=1 Tax=Fulvivirga sp. M361 TaxID=2594266 RepID=UPI001179D366|nr:MoaD/ThiS family protein [Fulvivirga sp. M361]TRX59504.1 MoaD/ThiS family protein [Fulvivirga sp. M361]